MKLKHTIKTLKHYPDDGRHQICITDLPFEITKGKDGFYYLDKNGKECKYNIYKTDIVDKRWIVLLDTGHKNYNRSLYNLFNVKLNKDLDKILKYCVDTYIKSLELEKERIEKEIIFLKNIK